MIEMFQMAELVDHNIVGNDGRQKRYFVIEIEVTPRGAAAPAASKVFDEYFSQRKLVVQVKEG